MSRYVDTMRAMSDAAKKSRKKGSDKPLPTDRINFEKQLAILATYAALFDRTGRKAVNIGEVAKVVGLKSGTAGLANAFLVEARLLARAEEQGFYIPSGPALQYRQSRTFGVEHPEHALAEAMRATWFFEAIASRLELQPLREPEVMAVLATAAGAGDHHKKQLALLLEYLLASGLVKRTDDDKISVGPSASPLGPPTEGVIATDHRRPVVDEAPRAAPQIADPHPGCIPFLLHFRGKPRGCIYVPEDMDADDLEIFDTMVAHVRARAGVRQMTSRQGESQ